MKNKTAEQNWWSALSNWMVKYQGRADHLFIYDGKHGRLNRCFDRNVSLHSVDEGTVSRLYQAAAEGRLGLLRPKDLKPQLLTTDPAKMFSSGKEVYVAQDRKISEERTVEDAIPELDGRKLERAAADPVLATRLHEAEAGYRRVVYAPPKTATSAPAEVSDNEKLPESGSGGEKAPAVKKTEQSADPERTVEAGHDTTTLRLDEGFGREQERLDEGFGREQEQLDADLVQMVLSLGKMGRLDVERLKRVRKAKEELIAAQNMFIWAAVSEKRDQEAFDDWMEWLEQSDKWISEDEFQHRIWIRQMTDMFRDLYGMDMAGASEQDCNEKIRDYLDGKRSVRQPEEVELDVESRQEEPEHPGEMWGNALRHFCRFAASEVPLSVRHVQVARCCRNIMREAAERGFGPNELRLKPQEVAAIKGTIEMGVLVERGLLAQAALTSEQQISRKQYRDCLRDFLAMKGIEEVLVPHVQTHQAEIGTGDGPISALQILMAHKGFLADDLREKTKKTSVLTHLERMDRQLVAQMIRRGDSELAALGQQVMVSNCQVSSALQNEPRHLHQPKAPQKGAPQL